MPEQNTRTLTAADAQKLDELHRFWLAPQGPGRPSRAQEVDTILTAWRSSKWSARAMLWLAGGFLTIMGAINVLKPYFGGGGQ